MKALIVYYTKTGHTAQAAKDISKGLLLEDVQCDVVSAQMGLNKDIREYEIVVFGSPTYGTKGYRYPAKRIQDFLDSLSSDTLSGKVCGAYTVNAEFGGRKLKRAMEMQLLKAGAEVVEGPVVKAGVPLSLWKGPDASEVDRKKCEEFGRALANAAHS
ncbi:MAG: flavodoxin domain-containing protein [Actinomycetota bacterium]|nr:flavodoxin domain-containing protein [Actinomycetota bacterium]